MRMATKAETRNTQSTFISNFAKAKEAFKDTFQSKEGETGLIGRTVEKGVERGIASFERKARDKLPDAMVLSGAGLLILFLLVFIMYWAHKLG